MRKKVHRDIIYCVETLLFAGIIERAIPKDINMSYIAAILELTAKWLVGNKNKWGHIIHLLSGMAWTVVAFQTGVYGLLVITIPAVLINCRNFHKWHKE